MCFSATIARCFITANTRTFRDGRETAGARIAPKSVVLHFVICATHFACKNELLSFFSKLQVDRSLLLSAPTCLYFAAPNSKYLRMLKIFVPVKRVVDYAAKIRVNAAKNGKCCTSSLKKYDDGQH